MVRDYYAASAVELRAVTHAAGTRRSVNLVAPDGTRTSLYDPRHPYDLLPDSALWRDGLRQARLVHAVIVNWARHPLREAVAQGVLTATDLQDWDGTNLHHREFAELADLVFMSSANLGQRAPEVAGSVLAEGRARMVAVTRGAAGSTVYPRAGEPFEVPAVPLPAGTVLDSNGAGDAFAAAFTAEVLRGETLEKAGEAGAIAGAVAIVADGDVAALAAG
jgi:sugar/nucleoside kinase (ribokinase family)